MSPIQDCFFLSKFNSKSPVTLYGCTKYFKFRPKSGSMLLYSRKKVRYRRDGYCWKKRKDGKTTREDHMKLKVQGMEVSYVLDLQRLHNANASISREFFFSVKIFRIISEQQTRSFPIKALLKEPVLKTSK